MFSYETLHNHAIPYNPMLPSSDNTHQIPGLQIVSHRDAVVRTQGAREVTVRIACPPQRSSTLSFTFTLTYDKPADSKDSDDTHEGLKLSRYGMQVCFYY